MTLFSYLVVLRHHRREGVARAAFLFLALGEAGFELIVAAFATQTGTLDLTQIAAHTQAVPAPCARS
jgi:formate hydrogenlyase subunit 3/multisubunit Na+/H+ antiporter MnhD subunit